MWPCCQHDPWVGRLRDWLSSHVALLQTRGILLLQPSYLPEDTQGMRRDTRAPRYRQSMDMSRIPCTDSAPPARSHSGPRLTSKSFSTLASYLFHPHPTVTSHTHTLSKTSECPGVLTGTRSLLPPHVCKCCSLYLEHSFFPLTLIASFLLLILPVSAERPFPQQSPALASYRTTPYHSAP